MKRSLTDEQLEEVRDLIDQEVSDTLIAKQYGISRPTVSGIRRGTNYLPEHKKTGPKTRPIEDLFWGHVTPGKEDECWMWNGASRNHQSHGTLSRNGVSVAAYRVAFEIHYRPLEKGEWVMHTCDQSLCVNPNHLYTGNRFDWAKKWHLKGPLLLDEVIKKQQDAQARSRARYAEKKDEIKEQSGKYQLRKKMQAVMVLGGKCQECEEDHPTALQFHHRNPADKSFSVNSKTLSSPNKLPWDRVLKEIRKCDLLCGNCHAKHHSKWKAEWIELERGFYA